MHVKSKLLLIALVSVLASCATYEPPAVRVVTQQVEIPIAIPCIVDVPPPPLFGFETIQNTQSLYSKVQILLSDREMHIAYEIELLGALKSCQ